MSTKPDTREDIKLDKELNLAADFTPPSYEDWKKAAESYLKGKPFEKALVTPTYEDINLQPIYRREDIENLPHLKGKPGFGNYARGTSPEGYLAHPWEICQEIACPQPESFNNALKHDLERGQTAVQLTPDTACRMGLDADTADPGQVGAGGVSISNLDDLETALNDINLGHFAIHIDAGFSALEMLTALVALRKKLNKPIDNLRGSIDADPLGFLAAHGRLPVSTKNSYDTMAQAASWSAACTPGLRTIGISGLPYHNAGASATQELAFTLATAVEYVDNLLERKMSIDEIAGQMRFTFAVGPNYFMEVAKIRAARILWAKIIEAYGGSEEAGKMVIHGVTSFYNQTKYDPYVNMLRTTTEAFSGIVAGVDSLRTNPFDQVYGETDKFSRRVARNTQIVLKEESHLDQLIDPAGGSYYVEKLTHDVAEKSWALFQGLQEKGGMLEALKNGTVQSQIETVTKKRKKDLAKRKAVLIGTNQFANVTEKPLEDKKPDYKAIHSDRAKRLEAYREGLSVDAKGEIEKYLARLTDPSVDDVVKAGAEAILAGATLGELYGAESRGEAVNLDQPLPAERLAAMFEELRDAVEAFEAKTGAKPKLFLANMGPLGQHKARADFSKGFFEVGGFDVTSPEGFDSPEAAIEGALDSGAPAVVICSTDDTYPEIVPVVVKGLKEKNKNIQVILAGYPKDQVEAHKEAGVDGFIYMGADVHAVLADVFKKIGVL